MAKRPLSADERALWTRVMANVRPLRAATTAEPTAPVSVRPERSRETGRKDSVSPSLDTNGTRGTVRPGTTLDAGWDRRLARGRVSPDRTVDLHGHTLGSAHDLLDRALDQAIMAGDRVVLLITGKPPGPDSERPHRRGAIRASVGDWLAHSRHARHIAAVRGAGPGHGGAGALYIVLRRQRERG